MQNWEENKISTSNVTLNRTRKRQCNLLASLVITKEYLLLRVIQINYKQLQKSKKVNYIIKNSNTWQSWQLTTLHIPVGKVKSTMSGSHIFQTLSPKGIAHLYQQCFYTQFSVRCNKSKILVTEKVNRNLLSISPSESVTIFRHKFFQPTRTEMKVCQQLDIRDDNSFQCAKHEAKSVDNKWPRRGTTAWIPFSCST